MATQTPTKEQFELVAIVLSVCAAVYAIVRWPLWWTFQKLVATALEKEIADMRATAGLTKAHADTLVMLQSAVEAHGIALREVPKMSGIMQEMTRTLEGLNETVGQLNQNMLDHGTELGRVTGFIDGVERRRKGRRKDDPPVGDHE